MEHQGFEHQFHYHVVNRAHAYQLGSRNCSLCLSEELAILYADPSTALNSRSKITATCRHKNKYKLKNIKPVGSTLIDLLPRLHTISPSAVLLPISCCSKAMAAKSLCKEILWNDLLSLVLNFMEQLIYLFIHSTESVTPDES